MSQRQSTPARLPCDIGHLLLEHQRSCVEKFQNQKSRLIADEMRVGKTMSAIGLDRLLDDGLRVVVCPKRALDVWRRHLEWIGEDVEVLNPDKGEKAREEFRKELLWHKTTSQRKWFVLHWDVLAKMEPTLLRIRPVHLIGDECHRIKNRKAQRTKVFKRIRAEWKTGLTGTPCDKPDELWSILHWLYPKHYTSYIRFLNRYVDWYENTQGYTVICGVQDEVTELWDEIEPFFIRRRLADVAEHMPEVRREVQYVEMGREQRRIYNDLEELSISEVEGGIMLPESPSERRTRLLQAASGTVTQNGRIKAPSAKTDALVDIMQDMGGDTPLVVFVAWRDMVDIIAARLRSEGVSVSTVRGGDTKADHQIRKFQDGETQVFVGTIRGANEAIDLSRANILVMFDLDAAPGANDQAEARVKGLNQQHCTVIELRAANTVEDDRAVKVGRKRKWINQIMGV